MSTQQLTLFVSQIGPSSAINVAPHQQTNLLLDSNKAHAADAT